MTNKNSHTTWIENEKGDRLKIELQNEGGECGELLGKIFIDKIPYHVFFAEPKEIGRGGEKFIVDRDPDYKPKQTSSGRYVLIAPYAK
jgi:hypothetical protein